MPYRTLQYGPGQQEYGPNIMRCNTGKRHVCLACPKMKYALNITQLTTLKYQKGPGLSLFLNLFPFLSQMKVFKLPSIHIIRLGVWICKILGKVIFSIIFNR